MSGSWKERGSLTIQSPVDGRACASEVILDGEVVSRSIQAYRIEHRAGQLPRIELDVAAVALDVTLMGEALGRFLVQVTNPRTGAMEEVRRIEFASGEVWDAAERRPREEPEP